MSDTRIHPQRLTRVAAAFLAAVLVLVAMHAAAPDPAFAAPDGLPPGHATMPDASADVLAEALAARKPRAEWETTQIEASRRALEALRRTPLPDPTKMARVRIVYRPDWTALGWRAEGAPASADFQLPWIDRPDLSEPQVTESSDFAAEIDEVLAILRAEREGRRVAEPGRFTGEKSFLGGGPNESLVQRAIWAAWLGRAGDARTIADAAIATGANVLDAFLARETERWFARGARLLVAGAPRAQALAVWEAAAAWAREAPGSVRLRELAKDLRTQAEDERAHPRVDVAKPESLPAAERATYFVGRFVDLTCRPDFGTYTSVVGGSSPDWFRAAVGLGRNALPALLAALDDRRLTRAPFLASFGLLAQDLHRVQDVALACLVAIEDDQPHPWGAISQLPDAKRAEAIAEVRAWWTKHGAEPELVRHVARLDAVDIGNLRRIEALDRSAVDGVAILHRWAERADGRSLIAIAEELAARGDLSLLPRVREIAAKSRSWEAVWYLLAHGDASDIRSLLAVQRADRRRGTRAGDENAAWPGYASAAAGSKRPEVVPLLVDALAAREMSGSRSVKGASSVPFCVADEAIEALVRITGHACGYDAAAPAAERFAAIDRWTVWWKEEGAAAFAKAHPGLADLVLDARPVGDAVERALTTPLVVVRSAIVATARWNVPRDDVRRLAASGAISVRTSPDGTAEFSFATGDVEAAWSAAARPAPDGSVPSMTVDLQDAWIDARGRLLGFERYGDAKVLRFDGRWTEVARPGPDPSWEHALPDAVLPGSGGAVLVVGQDQALDLIDGDGAAHAATFADLARARGERLRRAFRGVVVHRPEHRAMLVVDGRDRVWCRNVSAPGVSVLDGTEVREGPLPVLRKADPPYDRAIDAMAPLATGGVAVFTNQSSGAILDVADGAIVVVATFAVPGLHTAPREVLSLPDGVFLDGRRFDVAKRAWADERRPFLAAVAPDGGRWTVSEWNASNRSRLFHLRPDGHEARFDLAGDDGAADVEADGADAAFVLSQRSVRHLRLGEREIEETLRLPLPEGAVSIRSAGPGRAWVLSSFGGTGTRATLVCGGR